MTEFSNHHKLESCEEPFQVPLILPLLKRVGYYNINPPTPLNLSTSLAGIVIFSDELDRTPGVLFCPIHYNHI